MLDKNDLLYISQLLDIFNRVHRNDNKCCPNCGSIGNWNPEEHDTCYLCGYNSKKYIKLYNKINEEATKNAQDTKN